MLYLAWTKFGSLALMLVGMQDVAVITVYCMVRLHSSESLRQASLVIPEAWWKVDEKRRAKKVQERWRGEERKTVDIVWNLIKITPSMLRGPLVPATTKHNRLDSNVRESQTETVYYGMALPFYRTVDWEETIVFLMGRGRNEPIPHSKANMDKPQKGEINDLRELFSKCMLWFYERGKVSRIAGWFGKCMVTSPPPIKSSAQPNISEHKLRVTPNQQDCCSRKPWMYWLNQGCSL